MKHNFFLKPRATDYLQGDGHIQFKAVTNGDWNIHAFFNENQRDSNFDSDGCAPFGANRSLDEQMDALWPTLPVEVQSQLITLGFLDTGTDGNMHFHSSPRFTENLTGHGDNGNSIPECFDVIRKFGAIPWTDMPFPAGMTQAEYFITPTQAQLAKGQNFLSLMGGKNFCQYHWLVNGGVKNVPLMQSQILQAPLLLGVAVDEKGWNQPIPVDPPAGQPPQHVVTANKIISPSIDVVDNYNPYLKVLDAGYPIHYVLQAVISYIPPMPPVPVLPAQPTVQEEQTWLSSLSAWLTSLLKSLQGRNLSGADTLVDINEIEILSHNEMNTATNVGLQVVATGLVSLGATSIATNLTAGIVEIVLGIVVYAVYELIPTK